MKSIFSTYSQNENRVTSTILAVFERLNSSNLTTILQYLMDDSSIELMKFTNQIKTQRNGTVPDAEIKGGFRYLIETKISAALRKEQIAGHLEIMPSIPGIDSRLIILTSDSKKPKIVDEFEDTRLYWANFEKLVQAIDSVTDNNRFLTEREAYLLGELKFFIQSENLIRENIARKVLVIPASKWAKDQYERYYAYLCQPNRFFQQSTYLAYYFNGSIYKEVPKILAIVENFDFSVNEIIEDEVIMWDDKFDKKIILDRLKNLQSIVKLRNSTVTNNKIVFLSRTAEEGTEYLENDIPNDKTSSAGNRTAFVQGQRYVDLDKLKKAITTNDVEK